MNDLAMQISVGGLTAVVLAVVLILRGPRIMTLLIGKYLMRRWIAWIPLLGMALCILMVITVISVMGGFLRMFRASFHGIDGDIVVNANSLTGFPYYQEMIDRIGQLPEVGPGHAVPVLRTFGMLNIDNQKTMGVQVLGYPMDKIGNVNEFAESLNRQYAVRQDAVQALKSSDKLTAAQRQIDSELATAIKKKKTSHTQAYLDQLKAEQRELNEALASEPTTQPSFDLLPNQASVPLKALPEGVHFEDVVGDRLRYDQGIHRLIWDGANGINAERREVLLDESKDADYQRAIRLLAYKSNWQSVDYGLLLPRMGQTARNFPGMICSGGVLNIGRDETGKVVGRTPDFYRLPVQLIVPVITPGSSNFDQNSKAERHYWIVDDSRFKVWAADAASVYVPFDQLQSDLGMTATKDADGRELDPPRTSEICIRVKNGVDLAVAKARIQKVVDDVNAQHTLIDPRVMVETWEESQAMFLGAVEKEGSLMTVLFGLMSLVAVFCIFCIFYMIVLEKTRDIGIIKSVGATSASVAGVFLGYGLAIGLSACVLGLVMSYYLVTYINEIHTMLGEVFGVQIWNPRVYQFDTIPNELNWHQVAVILVAAVISAVVGALVPALRAASLHPIEALRWE